MFFHKKDIFNIFFLLLSSQKMLQSFNLSLELLLFLHFSSSSSLHPSFSCLSFHFLFSRTCPNVSLLLSPSFISLVFVCPPLLPPPPSFPETFLFLFSHSFPHSSKYTFLLLLSVSVSSSDILSSLFSRDIPLPLQLSFIFPDFLNFLQPLFSFRKLSVLSSAPFQKPFPSFSSPCTYLLSSFPSSSLHLHPKSSSLFFLLRSTSNFTLLFPTPFPKLFHLLPPSLPLCLHLFPKAFSFVLFI